jgi:hypothetical protein
MFVLIVTARMNEHLQFELNWFFIRSLQFSNVKAVGEGQSLGILL